MQRRRRRRLYRAWRRVSARQRLHYLGIDLSTLTSRAARTRGARRPLWGRAAALGLCHSVTGAPPPPPLSRLAACLSAPAPAAPRQGPIDAREPRGAGARRAMASVGRRGRLWWCTFAEPTLRRRRRRLYHAWRPLSARKRLHYLDRDLSRPESRAAWACGARWPRRARAAALSPAPSVAETLLPPWG